MRHQLGVAGLHGVDAVVLQPHQKVVHGRLVGMADVDPGRGLVVLRLAEQKVLDLVVGTGTQDVVEGTAEHAGVDQVALHLHDFSDGHAQSCHAVAASGAIRRSSRRPTRPRAHSAIAGPG